jgi:hypothetical protein
MLGILICPDERALGGGKHCLLQIEEVGNDRMWMVTGRRLWNFISDPSCLQPMVFTNDPTMPSPQDFSRATRWTE